MTDGNKIIPNLDHFLAHCHRRKYPAKSTIIYAGDESDALKKELLDHCKTGLARYKYPRWFNFLDDLPKTATGKIQRFRLRSD